ncbi:integrin-linked kinase-associated serine/threonine phosphatase 2C-like [Anneissia japonica]|uniref:integrin-linked kinase-associated serine/threonine phosphatase 2C-like n=1 Tax=Anneissia japonica TaxID=1529436 RepID=UPI001425BA16|nr:integrin-linked kinase-associated serine/threonine phosphatase 2C-like [Anneissia japonica]
MDLFSDLPDPDGDQNNARIAVPVTEKSQVTSTNDQVVPSSLDSTPDVATEERKRKLVTESTSNEDVSTEKKSLILKPGMYKLKGHIKEMKGERDEMQDAHVIIDDMTSELDNLPSSVSRLAYYAVFDGHGGARASKFAANKLHTHIIQKFPKTDVVSLDKEVKRCLIDSFKLTDEQFLKEASANKPNWKDGSTAICVLVVNNALYIANIGDSKALLCRFNEESKNDHFLPLSKDHNPTDYEERMRIQKAGGTVRNGRVMGILEVSRSLGDGRFKHCGITCIPDVKKCQLTEKDRFLILACDGLWKGFTIEGALEFINNKIKADEAGDKPDEDVDSKLEMACSRLAAEAIRRGSSDNVTVMLVSITHI